MTRLGGPSYLGLVYKKYISPFSPQNLKICIILIILSFNSRIMGNSEGRQETTRAYPDERKNSRTTAAAVMNQPNDTTIAGDIVDIQLYCQHTNPKESSAAVIPGQGPVTRQPQLDVDLSGKGPDEGGPREKKELHYHEALMQTAKIY